MPRMSQRSILLHPDPRLKKVCDPIADLDDELRRLADDMLETMYAAPGIGLAAPQVGVTRRLIVLDCVREGEGEPRPLIMFNPRIVAASDRRSTYEEGCLSIPEHYAEVERPAEVTVRWLDRAEPDLAEAREAARALVDEAARARGVMDRARAMLIQRQAADARFALDGAVAVATRSVRDMAVRRGIEIETRVEAGIEIDGDAMQIQQVLINLMLNAVQAMQAVSGERRLALEARREGGDIRLDVTDNGPGLTPELLANCFDPFFSTKPDGMGMGLAICRSCVEAHGGRIWATSPAGGGAAFHILLPPAGAG